MVKRLQKNFNNSWWRRHSSLGNGMLKRPEKIVRRMLSRLSPPRQRHSRRMLLQAVEDKLSDRSHRRKQTRVCFTKLAFPKRYRVWVKDLARLKRDGWTDDDTWSCGLEGSTSGSQAPSKSEAHGFASRTPTCTNATAFHLDCQRVGQETLYE
jgi:hypothetical protein